MNPVSQNIYITGAKQGSGKSVIMLAMPSGYSEKQGFFRPIVFAGIVNTVSITVIQAQQSK